MPACCQRTGLGLAIAHDATNQQIGIVECRAISMRKGVAKLSTLVNGARGFRGNVAGDTSWKGELLEEPLHPVRILGNIRVKLGVGPFKIGVGYKSGTSVTGTGDVDNIQLLLLDQPVQMNVDEVQTGCGSPVTQQSRLDMLQLERLAPQPGI